MDKFASRLEAGEVVVVVTVAVVVVAVVVVIVVGILLAVHTWLNAKLSSMTVLFC